MASASSWPLPTISSSSSKLMVKLAPCLPEPYWMDRLPEILLTSMDSFRSRPLAPSMPLISPLNLPPRPDVV